MTNWEDETATIVIRDEEDDEDIKLIADYRDMAYGEGYRCAILRMEQWNSMDEYEENVWLHPDQIPELIEGLKVFYKAYLTLRLEEADTLGEDRPDD